jgi:hypothetical protein
MNTYYYNWATEETKLGIVWLVLLAECGLSADDLTSNVAGLIPVKMVSGEWVAA